MGCRTIAAAHPLALTGGPSPAEAVPGATLALPASSGSASLRDGPRQGPWPGTTPLQQFVHAGAAQHRTCHGALPVADWTLPLNFLRAGLDLRACFPGTHTTARGNKVGHE